MELSFNVKRNVSFGGKTVSEYVTGLGVEKIKVLSEADYRAIATPDAKTMYLVQTENGIKFYLGNVSLYADGIPADVEQELRRIARIAEENQSTLETVVIPTLAGYSEAIQELSDVVMRSNSVKSIIVLTQAEYDALTPDTETLYIIT